MGQADTGSKQTINIYNKAWAEWVLQAEDVTVEAELSGEFQFIARASDSLMQVRGRDGRFLSLTELQLRHDSKMPIRLMAYATLARHKYEQDVFITVVQLLPPSGDAALVAAFHREFKGQIGHQDYLVINLWELDAKQMLAFNNPALLPFIPLMKGGNTEEVLRSCVTRIREEPRALELETILSVFASYVMDTDVIKRIVRWEMNILKESPILQEALAERYESGQREGLDQGITQGRYEESLAWLRRILTVRFQLDEVEFEKRGLAELTLEQLERLGDVALTAVILAEFDEAVNLAKE